MRHYPIRSYKHGLRKVFEERIKRYDQEDKSLGMHVHYNYYDRDRMSFVIDSNKLTEYREDGIWNFERKYDRRLDIEMQVRLLVKRIEQQEMLLERCFNPRNPSELLAKIYRKLEAIIDRKSPIMVLRRLYMNRPDLQKEFPEVMSGKYENLINWAS
jgi:hypothetical protein